jgi:hypothetical protein
MLYYNIDFTLSPTSDGNGYSVRPNNKEEKALRLEGDLSDKDVREVISLIRVAPRLYELVQMIAQYWDHDPDLQMQAIELIEDIEEGKL